MSITIRLFASLQAQYGETLTINLTPPILAKKLEEMLRQQGVWTEGARIAVNKKFATPEDTINQEDEVAVIPPVSGG